jgi:hypothetical protein
MLVFNAIRKVAAALFNRYETETVLCLGQIRWKDKTMIIAPPYWNLYLKCTTHGDRSFNCEIS